MDEDGPVFMVEDGPGPLVEDGPGVIVEVVVLSAGGHGLMHWFPRHFLKPAGQKVPRTMHALAEIQGIFDSRVVGQARILLHINIKIVACQIP